MQSGMADSKRLYPNCDASLWLRSCEEEILQPLETTVTGEIPAWLDGTLVRNGPGSIKVGDEEFQHLFDSSALLHRFRIVGGGATYQCRFLRSRTYRRNSAANRIVVSEFGTAAAPDPCHTIFDRFSSLFKPGDGLSDNAMISVYPFGDQLYAFAESPVIHRVEPATLDTLRRVNLADHVAIVNHTSHPHVMPNGDVYNVGMGLRRGRLRHVVVHFPHRAMADMFETAAIVGSVRPRWPLHPAYMHSFGITEHYFVIVEQPLTVSLMKMVRGTLSNRPLNSCLEWFPEQETHVILIRRSDGREERRYRTSAIFFLHVINAYEKQGRLVVDLCAYRDPRMLQAMYIESIKTMQSNASYADMFRGRPQRLTLSLDAPLGARPPFVVPELLVDVGCETPRIHYDLHNGRPYRYFYAISSDVDAPNPGTIIKVDTETRTVKTWCEENCYPSEPVFVPSPDSTEEDGGVLLSALVWGGADERRVGLLVLDARDLSELARAVCETPSPAPKCLHGWFLKS